MQEQLIDVALARWAKPQNFEVKEQVESPQNFNVYKLDYYQDEGLHTLEAFAEGTFTVGKLRIERKYIPSGSTAKEKKIGAADDFTYYTKVVNTETEANPVGQVGIVHGFSEESDIFLELAYQLALNGFVVHIIDNDSYGYSSGARCVGPSIEKMHHNTTALLGQFQEGLPTFLWGNSMGCLILNSFLVNNPGLKIEGVIFGSPFFDMAEHIGMTWDRKLLVRFLAPFFEGFCMQGTVEIHRVGQDKNYIRKALTQRKAISLIGMQGIVNMLDAIANIHKNAAKFSYPFMMMLGSFDTVVSNTGALKWYDSTSGQLPKEKVMFDGFVHELHKEPGKDKVFKHALLYLSKRISQDNVTVWKKPQAAQQLKQGLYGARKGGKLRRLVKWALILYLLVGLVFAIIKRKRGLFFKWPKALLSK